MAEQRSVDIPGIDNEDILYHYRLGVFHAMWGSIDLVTDMAIGRFLGLGHDDTHAVTWGMMFGAKAKLLANLIRRSEHPSKATLLTSLNALRGDAKRDILAHGYQVEGHGHVGFLERPRGGSDKAFKGTLHLFTYETFRLHVNKLIGDGIAFMDILDYDQDDINAFAEAARSKTISA